MRKRRDAKQPDRVIVLVAERVSAPRGSARSFPIPFDLAFAGVLDAVAGASRPYEVDLF